MFEGVYDYFNIVISDILEIVLVLAIAKKSTKLVIKLDRNLSLR